MAWREPEDGEHSEKLDAYFNKADQCWTCARCLGVLGSIGCCRNAEKQRQEHEEKARQFRREKARQRAREGHAPPDYGGPFDVRGVDEERRRYFMIVPAIRLYHDACLTADAVRASVEHHVIVWCRTLERPLYDSRRMSQKVEGPEPL